MNGKEKNIENKLITDIKNEIPDQNDDVFFHTEDDPLSVDGIGSSGIGNINIDNIIEMLGESIENSGQTTDVKPNTTESLESKATGQKILNDNEDFSLAQNEMKKGTKVSKNKAKYVAAKSRKEKEKGDIISTFNPNTFSEQDEIDNKKKETAKYDINGEVCVHNIIATKRSRQNKQDDVRLEQEVNDNCESIDKNDNNDDGTCSGNNYKEQCKINAENVIIDSKHKGITDQDDENVHLQKCVSEGCENIEQSKSKEKDILGDPKLKNNKSIMAYNQEHLTGYNNDTAKLDKNSVQENDLTLNYEVKDGGNALIKTNAIDMKSGCSKENIYIVKTHGHWKFAEDNRGNAIDGQYDVTNKLTRTEGMNEKVFNENETCDLNGQNCILEAKDINEKDLHLEVLEVTEQTLTNENIIQCYKTNSNEEGYKEIIDEEQNKLSKEMQTDGDSNGPKRKLLYDLKPKSSVNHNAESQACAYSEEYNQEKIENLAQNSFRRKLLDDLKNKLVSEKHKPSFTNKEEETSQTVDCVDNKSCRRKLLDDLKNKSSADNKKNSGSSADCILEKDMDNKARRRKLLDDLKSKKNIDISNESFSGNRDCIDNKGPRRKLLDDLKNKNSKGNKNDTNEHYRQAIKEDRIDDKVSKCKLPDDIKNDSFEESIKSPSNVNIIGTRSIVNKPDNNLIEYPRMTDCINDKKIKQNKVYFKNNDLPVVPKDKKLAEKSRNNVNDTQSEQKRQKFKEQSFMYDEDKRSVDNEQKVSKKKKRKCELLDDIKINIIGAKKNSAKPKNINDKRTKQEKETVDNKVKTSGENRKNDLEDKNIRLKREGIEINECALQGKVSEDRRRNDMKDKISKPSSTSVGIKDSKYDLIDDMKNNSKKTKKSCDNDKHSKQNKGKVVSKTSESKLRIDCNDKNCLEKGNYDINDKYSKGKTQVVDKRISKYESQNYNSPAQNSIDVNDKLSKHEGKVLDKKGSVSDLLDGVKDKHSKYKRGETENKVSQLPFSPTKKTSAVKKYSDDKTKQKKDKVVKNVNTKVDDPKAHTSREKIKEINMFAKVEINNEVNAKKGKKKSGKLKKTTKQNSTGNDNVGIVGKGTKGKEANKIPPGKNNATDDTDTKFDDMVNNISYETSSDSDCESSQQDKLKRKGRLSIVLRKHIKNIKTIMRWSNATPIRRFDGIGYECAFCEVQYHKPFDLKKHTLESHHKFSDAYFTKKNDMVNYFIKLDITDLECRICSNKIESVEDLIDHLLIDHEKTMHRDIKSHIVPFKFDTKDPDILSCYICSTTYSKFKMLLEHVITSHCRNYICDHCDLGFVNISKLQYHLRIHDKGSFKCDFCDKELETMTRKKAHEKCHRSRGGWKCVYCGERFKDYFRKQKHLAAAHGVELPKIVCNACNRFFTCRLRYREHVKRDHLLERSHECTECDMKFFRSADLKYHMLKHTNKKDFQCQVCYRMFSRKSYLTQHMRSHNDDRRFTCDRCGSRFLQKITWRRHVETVHGVTA